MTSTADDSTTTATASMRWRSVALPREHGGWGLTLEPVLLGLLVAWSPAGLLLGIATFGVFLARTPLRVVAVDVRRRRWRDRSRTALRLAAIELAIVAAAVVTAVVWSGWRWTLPVLAALPLVAIEAYYDVRSRGRRLVPELCGAIGVAASVGAIVLADRDDVGLAIALWLVLAGRAFGSIPHVRARIARLHHRDARTWSSDVASFAAVALAALAVGVDDSVLPGAILVAVIAVGAAWTVRRPPPPVKVLGIRQMLLGLALVVVTAVGVALG